MSLLVQELKRGDATLWVFKGSRGGGSSKNSLDPNLTAIAVDHDGIFQRMVYLTGVIVHMIPRLIAAREMKTGTRGTHTQF